MKLFKRIFFFSLGIILLLTGIVWIYLWTTKPVYSGNIPVKGMSQPVETYFDSYGIPHIYGQNEEDVFRALGYIQAQDRLFQMEMLRRVSAGRLCEIFGSSLLDVDRFFRMLGIAHHAEASAQHFSKDTISSSHRAALAYIEGVNEYLENGKTPVEFQLLGIPKEKFTVKDLYLIVDFMSFNFQMGFRTDPLMSRIRKNFSEDYLKDLALGYVPGTLTEPVHFPQDSMSKIKDSTLISSIDKVEELLPFKIWMGSNAWVVSANRSSSGKVLFANDTHIGHQQPAVWYEAHLECPGFSFYGNFLAGFPFAPIGHSLRHAWGLTIFENDDLDFFVEKPDSTNPNRIWRKDRWEELSSREEIIHVKDSADIRILCRSSDHGPICSDVMSDFKDITTAPVAACWSFLKEENNLLEATYDLAHATSMENFRAAVSQIAAPGLNVLYGDTENNIAWWTAAKIVNRPKNVNPSLLLDGSTGNDDWLGYFPFSANPRSENPPNGYVYSTNNQPDSVNHVLYPGYYLPEDRAVRVTQFLNSRGVFDVHAFQQLNTDVINPVAAQNGKNLLISLPDEIRASSTAAASAAAILEKWNGSHQLEDCAPTIYYRWLYEVLHRTFADEMGEKDFEAFLKTHVEKCSVAPFLKLNESVWWDNVKTTDKKESKKEIVGEAFLAAVGILVDKLGPDPEKWAWKRVHTLEFEHPLGKQKPLDRFFNIGPFPEMGGIETVNNQSFNMTADYRCKTNLGPALRRILDFSDPEHGISINPTGQSGNFMSDHYDDQSALYVRGLFRAELMNRDEIIRQGGDALMMEPVK